jgi:hypothetical protein
MGGRGLITQSLLSAWGWIFNPYSPDKAYDNFLSVLERKASKPNKAMQNGINFERLVMDITDGKDCGSGPWHESAAHIADELRGGQFQLAAKAPAEIDGESYLLYGRLDCLKAGVISDIKFVKKYYTGKFYNSLQHPMYFEIVPEAYRFDYLVSDGTDVWRESYRRETSPPITASIAEFAEWLKTRGLWQKYQSKWAAL